MFTTNAAEVQQPELSLQQIGDKNQVQLELRKLWQSALRASWERAGGRSLAQEATHPARPLQVAMYICGETANPAVCGTRELFENGRVT